MKSFLLLFTIVGCASPTTTSDGRIAVGDNTLGVASLEVVRSEGTFELRALDRDDNEVASIVKHASAELGVTAKIDLTVGNKSLHSTWYSPEQFLQEQSEADFRALLLIKPVVTELAREHVFALLSNRPDMPAAEKASSVDTETCSPTILQSAAAKANECCSSQGATWYWDGYEYVEYDVWYEDHIPASGDKAGWIVQRQYNAAYGGAGCKKSDGYTACTSGQPPSLGGDCYFGSAGWAIVGNVAPPPGGSYVVTTTYQNTFGGYMCNYATSGTSTFGNVTGTLSSPKCPGGTAAAAYWQDNASY